MYMQNALMLTIPYTTRFRSWLDVDDALADELRERLTRLGHAGGLREAFAEWAGAANLEERVDGVTRIDPVVLEALRKESDRKSTRLNSSHRCISYAVVCLKK